MRWIWLLALCACTRTPATIAADAGTGGGGAPLAAADAAPPPPTVPRLVLVPGGDTRIASSCSWGGRGPGREAAEALCPTTSPRATQNVAAAVAELDRSTWTPLVAVPSVGSRTLMRAEYKSLPCQFEPWLELIAVDPRGTRS